MIRPVFVMMIFLVVVFLETCHVQPKNLCAQKTDKVEQQTDSPAKEKGKEEDQTTEEDPTTEIRILTYNIHGGKGLDGKIDLNRIAAVIKQANPHLVALQEVDVNTRRSGKVDQAKKLAQLCNMQSVFGKAINYQGGQYGNAVLASQKIIASNSIEVSNEGAERRVAVGAAIKIDKKNVVTLISTHFDHKSQAARASAARVLAGIVKQSTGIVLIAGDLNCALGSKELASLESVAASPSDQPVFTFPAANPSKQIDFILIAQKAKWKLQKMEAIDDGGASDHRPLLAVFTVE